MNLDDKTIDTWDKAEECNCDEEGCIQNHKLCGICKETIIYTAHVSNQPNSWYAWDKDHKNPKSKGGKNKIKNLQAVHVRCNRKKGNK